MASGFDIVVLMYTCGVTGSAIGVLLFNLPKNSHELFDRFTRCLLWPLDVYHSYKQSLAQRDDVRLAFLLQHTLARQTLAIRKLTENLAFERDRYHKLLIDYKRLKAETENKPPMNGADFLKLEAPENHE